MTELVLINPNGRVSAPNAACEPPLWLGLIAGYRIAQGDEVAIVDAEAEGLTVEQTTRRVIDLCPKDTVIVVMGNNPSVSSTPKVPVAEELFKSLIQMVTILGKRTQVQFTGLHPVCMNWANTISEPFKGCPTVPWDLLPMDKYRAHNWHCLADIDNRSRYAVLYTSLNCPYPCYYCNVHTLYGDRKVRYRPMQDIRAELDLFARRGIQHIKIWDELFCLNEKRVYEICDFINGQGYNFNIWAYARVDIVGPHMLRRMKVAGINWLAYGFESANQKVRSDLGKRFQQFTAERIIALTRDAGINIMGNFMFGLPGETEDNWKASLDFAVMQNFEYVNFYVALPYPGSQWWADLPSETYHSRVSFEPTDWTRFSQFSPNMYGDPMAIKFRDDAFQMYFKRPEYLSMIRAKFGGKAEAHIKEMVSWKIR